MATATGPHSLIEQLRDPAASVRLLRNAALLHLDGDLVGARRLYEEALETEPEHPVALSNLGLLLQQQGEVEAALEVFARLGDDVERSPVSLTNEALAEIASGDLLGGIGHLEQAVAMAPESGPWSSLAKARLLVSEGELAFVAAKCAAQQHPMQAETWQLVGTCAAAAGDVDAAVEAFGHAVELDSQSAAAWRQLGAAMFARQDLGSAAAATERARLLEPAVAAHAHQAGLIAVALGDVGAAEAAFDAAILCGPETPAVVDRAIMYLAAHDIAGALNLLEDAPERESERVQLYLAFAYLADGREPDGVAILHTLASGHSVEADRAREALAQIERKSDG